MCECVPSTNNNTGPASSNLSPIEILEGTAPTEDPNVASLYNPCGVAVCPMGERVYIADTGHHRICVLERGGLRVLAGSGTRGFADGAASKAAFAHPCGIALDSSGLLYVADCGNHRIRAVTPEGVVSTVAGNGTAAHRDGPAQYAAFFNPCGVAIDADDFLYVTDYSNNRVRVLSRGGVVSTLATCSALGMEDERLNSPYGIAVHSVRGSTPLVYVSSFHSNSLTCIDPNSGVTTLIAGCGSARHADGLGEAAAFSAPNGLSVDADGNVYVADSGSHTIRRVTPEGEAVTLAGSGAPGLSPRHFNSPCGLCMCLLPGAGAALLVADRSNSCLRIVPVEEALPPQAPDRLRTAPLPRRLSTSLLSPTSPISPDRTPTFTLFTGLFAFPKDGSVARLEKGRTVTSSGPSSAETCLLSPSRRAPPSRFCACALKLVFFLVRLMRLRSSTVSGTPSLSSLSPLRLRLKSGSSSSLLSSPSPSE